MIIEKICEELNVPIAVFSKISSTAPYRYKEYEIPKKNGGKRKIAQPAREIKLLQRAAVSVLKDMFPIHGAAAAYVPGSSIKKNAVRHKDNPYLIKLDFVDFFNSIVERDFRGILLEHKIPPHEVMLLGRLFFWRKVGHPVNVLSVGAPSSPWVSNIMLFDFDVKASELAEKSNVVYTRYADDITLSGKVTECLMSCYLDIAGLIKDSKRPLLAINNDKTVFLSPRTKRVVTGLVLTNDKKVSVGRERKRLIRSMVHRYRLGELDYSQIQVLSGWLAFLKGIEPNYWHEHYRSVKFGG